MMKLDTNSIISSHQITVEVDGVVQNNIIEIDTDSGEATVYKWKDGKVVRDVDGSVISEKVTFPVDKLHVYLVKPK